MSRLKLSNSYLKKQKVQRRRDVGFAVVAMVLIVSLFGVYLFKESKSQCPMSDKPACERVMK